MAKRKVTFNVTNDRKKNKSKLVKPIRRETDFTIFYRGENRPVIVEIKPPGMIICRIKGTRKKYTIRADAVIWRLAKTEAFENGKDKKKKKKSKKTQKQGRRRL